VCAELRDRPDGVLERHLHRSCYRRPELRLVRPRLRGAEALRAGPLRVPRTIPRPLPSGPVHQPQDGHRQLRPLWRPVRPWLPLPERRLRPHLRRWRDRLPAGARYLLHESPL
jgi:hypothetical protein